MEFIKMQAGGNDFIFLDLRREKRKEDWRFLAKKSGDRHFGIGGDGLLVLTSAKEAAGRLEMWNPDGSKGEICGNGLCCVGLYLFLEQEEEKAAVYVLETDRGIRKIAVCPEEEGRPLVRVCMGMPTVEKKYTVRMPERYWAYEVDAGNQHLVVFPRQWGPGILRRFAPSLSRHPAFQRGCNVELVSVVSRQELQVLVWERGAGETLACGSGAAAVYACAKKNSLISETVWIHMPGGSYRVWEEAGEVWIETLPEIVYFGKVPESWLSKALSEEKHGQRNGDCDTVRDDIGPSCRNGDLV